MRRGRREAMIAREQRRIAAWRIKAPRVLALVTVFILELTTMGLAILGAWLIYMPAGILTAALCCGFVVWRMTPLTWRRP